MESHQPIIDRRIIRTREVIYETFISLLSETEFSRISIKDITNQANISRSTFYAHYQDKYDWLDKTVQEKLSELKECLRVSKPNLGNDQSSLEMADPYYESFFENIATNQKFYHTMFTKIKSEEFLQKLYKVIREDLYHRISSMNKKQSLLVPLDILLDSSSSSIIGITKVWVEKNMIYSPHYMALQLTRLAIGSLYRAMGKVN
ncbi:TetR/AcrR family transcriptional regulator [Peribacillus sp. NPDC097264]|uniref:TetR/AcrR family transcriptional regulator n=1 Tax=Peribacillus sp. NPDC097264 TaxID=3390616 RepID=UPI003CFD88A7